MRTALRRFGAIVLLATWSQVATANAVPCAIWCAFGNDIAAHDLASEHHHGAGPVTHDGGSSVSGSYCGVPQLLVVTAVGPDLPALPSQVVTAGEQPVAPLHSFVSSLVGFDTPPPRV